MDMGGRRAGSAEEELPAVTAERQAASGTALPESIHVAAFHQESAQELAARVREEDLPVTAYDSGPGSAVLGIQPSAHQMMEVVVGRGYAARPGRDLRDDLAVTIEDDTRGNPAEGGVALPVIVLRESHGGHVNDSIPLHGTRAGRD